MIITTVYYSKYGIVEYVVGESVRRGSLSALDTSMPYKLDYSRFIGTV